MTSSSSRDKITEALLDEKNTMINNIVSNIVKNKNLSRDMVVSNILESDTVYEFLTRSNCMLIVKDSFHDEMYPTTEPIEKRVEKIVAKTKDDNIYGFTHAGDLVVNETEKNALENCYTRLKSRKDL
jgi:hypothetical protein